MVWILFVAALAMIIEVLWPHIDYVIVGLSVVAASLMAVILWVEWDPKKTVWANIRP